MNVLPILGAGLSLFGAIQQQQQASAAAGLSREALELQKKVVDAFLKELEELKPYRQALRELGSQRMGMAPLGWSRWTSDPWRLQPLQLPTPPGSGNGKNGDNKNGDKQKPPNGGKQQPPVEGGPPDYAISPPSPPSDNLLHTLPPPESWYWGEGPGAPFAGVPDSKTGFGGGEGKAGTGGFIDGGKIDFGGGIGKGNGKNGKNGKSGNGGWGNIGDLFSDLGII